MSGRGKGGKVKGKAKSRSSRAGFQLPIRHIHFRGALDISNSVDRQGSRQHLLFLHLYFSVQTASYMLYLAVVREGTPVLVFGKN